MFLLSLQRNPWSSNIDISFEDAKYVIALDNCDYLSSTLGPKHLSFEIHIISYIVVATLLPWIESLSTLSLCDTLLTFCIATHHKINLSFFILNNIIEASVDP